MDGEDSSAACRRPALSGVVLSLFLAAGLCAVVLLAADAPRFRAPEVVLNCPFGDAAVDTADVFLSGRVSPASAATALFLDGAPLPLGRDAAWLAIRPLAEGPNHFSLLARDVHGATAAVVLAVTRELRRPLPPPDARLRLALLPARADGDAGPVAEWFATSLEEEVFAARRFRLVDRARLNTVLTEHRLQQLDLFRDEAMLQIGQLLVADAVVAFRVAETEETFTVRCRAMEVATGEVVWRADYSSPSGDPATVDLLARGIALDLARLFGHRPAVVVDASDWPRVYIDLGQSHGVRAGGRVVWVDGTGSVRSGRVEEALERASRVVFDADCPPPAPAQPVWIVGFRGAAR